MKKKLEIQRVKGDFNQTTGVLSILDNGWPLYVAPVIERGFRNNEKNVSNIPAGIYPLVREWSPRFKQHLWEFKQVPNRSECKFHAAKFWTHLEGCISPGYYLTDINKDGYQDVAYSKNAMRIFHRVMDKLFPEGKAEIQIIDPIEEMYF